ncbi:hypothetical protein [Microbacterium sp. MM2322]|uniref:hypothetical protein n=1 Tax=Microbacterium sp. MM2322 TaxID=3157631 RepID=UPI0032D58F62
MDDDDAAELARLRERAYGRTADIAEDAAALQRLRELEAQAAHAASDASTIDVAAEAATSPEPEPAPPPDDADDERPYGAPRRWPRWAAGAALTGSAAALVAGTVAITLAIPRDEPRYAEAVQVTTLTSLVPWPPENDSDSRRYADFRGFSVFANTVGTPADPNPVRCLSIVSPEEAAEPTIGETLSACGAGPFPVSVTAVISTLSPPAAQEAYDLGTAVNFTLGEAGVEVWVARR